MQDGLGARLGKFGDSSGRAVVEGASVFSLHQTTTPPTYPYF